MGSICSRATADDTPALPLRARERVKSLVKNHRLAPYCTSVDSCLAECPICFLNQPTNDMNLTSCCNNPICTDCLVQMVFTQPVIQSSHRIRHQQARNELSGEDYTPPSCPFCTALLSTRYQKGLEVVAEDIRPRSNANALRTNLLSSTAARTPAQQAFIDKVFAAAAVITELMGRRRESRMLGLFRIEGGERIEALRVLAVLRGMGIDIEELMVVEALRMSMCQEHQNTGELVIEQQVQDEMGSSVADSEDGYVIANEPVEEVTTIEHGSVSSKAIDESNEDDKSAGPDCITHE